MADNPWVEKLEHHSCYQRIDSKARKLFDSNNADPEEALLSSLEGRRSGGHFGEKGYLLITTHGLYWSGRTGGYESYGFSFFLAVSSGRGPVALPGNVFYAAEAKELQQFIDFFSILGQVRSWGAAQSPAAATPSSSEDKADRIGKLVALKEQGNITSGEYELMKAEILNGS